MRAASLPWYDLPEIREATDGLWRAVARRLRESGVPHVPDTLDRRTPCDTLWRSSRLLLSQCCGYDVVLPFRGDLRPVATPCYEAPGCEAANYRSWIVVRGDSPWKRPIDLRGGRCAINMATSHSGMNALRRLLARAASGRPFFSTVRLAGSHERSLELVRGGEADVTSIDAVVYELLRRHRPSALEGLKAIGLTDPAPAPPFVTHVSTNPHDVVRLRAALAGALADPSTRAVRETLLLEQVEVVPMSAYESIARWERAAVKRGFVDFPHHENGNGAGPA